MFAWEFSFWKLRHLRRCFPELVVKDCKHPSYVPLGETLAVWGMKEVPHDYLKRVSLIRVEDGFLRSVGLGADLAMPLSWVIDRRGMHYDCSKPSDLELMLLQTNFSEQLLERANSLRKHIVEMGVTKYNLQGNMWVRRLDTFNVILVAGQVESDASITFGSVGFQTNLNLLKKVRQDNPLSYIVYKPHPDVLSGMRRKGVKEEDASLWCDEIVGDVCTSSLLSQVDEVHVMTSQLGFEGLLRGKKVVCYGLPFYAGWGLTHDRFFIERRTRRLNIDELVACALILYPIYMSKDGKSLISPEEALKELSSLKKSQIAFPVVLKEIYRCLLRLWIGVR